MSKSYMEQQISVGKEGERIFLESYPWFQYNNVKNCRAPDFIHRETGALVELKYDVSKKAKKDKPGKDGKQINFFVERYSDRDRKTLGGPFRAAEEGVDYYVYMFKEPKRTFFYNAVKFRDITEKLIRNGRYEERGIPIPNQGWTTTGFPLPISEFEDAKLSPDVVKKGIRFNIS